MSRFHSYLDNAAKIIHSYEKGVPLHFHLKKFFRAEKKYGSNDRKIISSLCYNYFRCFNLFKGVDFSFQHLLNAFFLCENTDTQLLKTLDPELNERIKFPIVEKLVHLGLKMDDVFGFSGRLSELIDEKLFSISFLIQPALFLRIRPGKKEKVLESLKSIEMDLLSETSLKIANGVNVENVVRLNKDAVVQDFSSQNIFNDFIPLLLQSPKNEKKISVWDVCAASGGKSILLYDLLKGYVKLTVSDIRKNILNNLESRLKDAGINIYKKFEQDITIASGLEKEEKFNVVLCDVPCSGSGTWSRTPEQHFSFEISNLSVFVEKQKSIIKNVIPHLADNGFLVYITCSVFKSENEDMVQFIQDNFSLELIHMNYVSGYEIKADSMFTAIFKA